MAENVSGNQRRRIPTVSANPAKKIMMYWTKRFWDSGHRLAIRVARKRSNAMGICQSVLIVLIIGWIVYTRR